MIDRITTALSRRNLLIGLAACATAASAAEASSTPSENPELLALADEIPGAVANYNDARKRVREIVTEWSPQWPVPHEDLICYYGGCREYRSIDGCGIEMPLGKSGIKMMPQIGTAEHFTTQLTYHEREATRRLSLKSQRGAKGHLRAAEKNRALIDPARKFWDEIDRITKVSGIKPAQAELAETRAALKEKIDLIMRAEDWSIAGTVIKAQALQAWANVEPFYRHLNPSGPLWDDQLAASIMRHAQAA